MTSTKHNFDDLNPEMVLKHIKDMFEEAETRYKAKPSALTLEAYQRRKAQHECAGHDFYACGFDGMWYLYLCRHCNAQYLD